MRVCVCVYMSKCFFFYSFRHKNPKEENKIEKPNLLLIIDFKRAFDGQNEIGHRRGAKAQGA